MQDLKTNSGLNKAGLAFLPLFYVYVCVCVCEVEYLVKDNFKQLLDTAKSSFEDC